jgi:hypothetical protein
MISAFPLAVASIPRASINSSILFANEALAVDLSLQPVATDIPTAASSFSFTLIAMKHLHRCSHT